MKKFFTFLAASAVAACAMAAPDMSYTITPESGTTVTELSTITLTYPAWDWSDINDNSGIKLTHNGTPLQLDMEGSYDGGIFTFKLAEPATAPGEYELNISSGAICVGMNDGSDYADIEEDLKFKWTIAGESVNLDFTCNSDPADKQAVDGIEAIEYTFPGLDAVEVEAGNPAVKVDGTDLLFSDYSVFCNANKVILSFEPAISEGEVSVIFPAGSVKGTKDTDQTTNPADIAFSYMVAAPVVYDLTLKIGTPKPNDDGEIDLSSKSMTSPVFYCEVAGLDVAEGTEANVTIKEVNGDFERSARLTKSFGINSNWSYFTANFGSEPSFNGDYVITVAKGAFGNAAWIANPAYGQSNDEIKLTFKVIGAKDYEVNTLEAKITPDPTATYKSFADFATVKLTFDTEVTASEEAAGTIVDNGGDFNFTQTKAFTKDGDAFAVTFEAPSNPAALTSYTFSVPAGVFKDANGAGNKEISVVYTVSDTDGVDMILDEENAAPVYNLQGVRVNANELPAGIYIRNGKKFVVK